MVELLVFLLGGHGTALAGSPAALQFVARHDRRNEMSRALRILAAVTMMAAVSALPALAQGRGETLIVVVESGPNSMDIHGVGANRPAYQASWNLYDRLMTFGVKTLPDGSRSYDYSVLKPELAESRSEERRVGKEGRSGGWGDR